MNNNYLDNLLMNYPLDSELSSDSIHNTQNIKQKAGDKPNLRNRPHGGFLPIYICTREDIKEEKEDNKLREYTTVKTAVSIQDIMQKRRNIKPFLSL
jgi:hypothetical protein